MLEKTLFYQDTLRLINKITQSFRCRYPRVYACVIGIFLILFVLSVLFNISLAAINFYTLLRQKSTPELPRKSTTEIEKRCFEENFSGNETKWKTKFYRSEDGFWCPTKFTDPVIWYEDGLKANFENFSIEYEIKRDEKLKTDNPPSFIFAYGKEDEEDGPIFKLWVPENPNLQLFGFAKNLDFEATKSALIREIPETLSEPVKIGKVTNTLVFVPTHREGNNLFLNFTFKYTSSRTDKSENDTFSKKIKLPISDIPTSAKTFPFGIGTYIGNCIKPISYEICL